MFILILQRYEIDDKMSQKIFNIYIYIYICSSSSIAIALQAVSGLKMAFQTRRELAHLSTIAIYVKRFEIGNMNFFVPFHAFHTFANFSKNDKNSAIWHWENIILMYSVH